MKLKEKLRLALLAAKSSRSVEETAEYNTLVESAKAAGLDADIVADEFAPDAEEAGETVSSGELTELIAKAVSKALPANAGVDTEALLSEIRSSKSLKADDVESLIKKHVGAGVDHSSLVAEVKKLMPEQGITSKELTAALDNFAKSIRTPSKVEFDATSAQFPCEHRSGNMSVAQKQLLNIMVMGTSDEAKASTQRLNGGKSLPSSMNDGITASQLAHAAASGERAIKSLRESILYGNGAKALTTTGSGTGLELMPSDLSADLQMRMFIESMLAAEMLAAEIQMPTQPFELPLITTRPNFYTGTQAPGSDPTASDPGTGKITLDSKKLIGMSEYSYEADEDSIIAILPMIQEQLGAGAADAYEDALINGDTAGTQDTGTGATAALKIFNGFRKLALANTATKKTMTGGITADNISVLRKAMGKFGMRPADLMLLVGPNGYNDIVNLDETLTFDKVGSAAAARILTGNAASIFGIRIVVSSKVLENLTSAGIYDGATTTQGSLLLVNKSQFLVGSRRGFTVEVDVDRKRQVNAVIASFRRAFTPKETPSASNPSVVIGINYAA
jgi:HK97 family phage major capsid protein